MSLDDVVAFDTLARHPRLADLVALTRAVSRRAAEGRLSEWTDERRVRELAGELNLSNEDATTTLGDPIAVLSRGPEKRAERQLLRALFAFVVAEERREAPEVEHRLAGDLLWLATHTPLDATPLLDRALGDSADETWKAIADRVRRIDDEGPRPGALGRAEALVGCAALAQSGTETATRLVAKLKSELHDPSLLRVLSSASSAPQVAEQHLSGELVQAPRSPWLTCVLAFTGVLFLLHVLRIAARAILAYRRPAEVTLTSASVRIRARTELLGRTLRDREIVIAQSGLARAHREVRYPRAAFYAGLLALAVGSYFGVLTFVDGLRAASPSLLGTGLLLVALGIALDFALGSIGPGTTGRCRVAFVPRAGGTVCIGNVEIERANNALARLAQASRTAY